jgi:hypothetical protein
LRCLKGNFTPITFESVGWSVKGRRNDELQPDKGRYLWFSKTETRTKEVEEEGQGAGEEILLSKEESEITKERGSVVGVVK